MLSKWDDKMWRQIHRSSVCIAVLVVTQVERKITKVLHAALPAGRRTRGVKLKRKMFKDQLKIQGLSCTFCGRGEGPGLEGCPQMGCGG